MKKWLAYVLSIAMILCCVSAAAEGGEMLSAADLFEKCVGSTVHIETNSGGGTGFFVGENTIATNNHVIAGAEWLTVKMSDGQIHNVTAILARSENPDLALLEVDVSGPVVTISQRELRNGEDIYAIGAPMGIYPCISNGIVMKRSHEDQGVDYILSNIHAIGGNSGGPVFNAYGEVVGLVTLGIPDGPNAIDLITDVKYLAALDMGEPTPVLTRDEWMAERNKPEEDNYEHASSIADAQVGQLVKLGRYEQDADEGNGPEEIYWIVTGREGDQLTLMSLYCLDTALYNTELVDTTWETSYARAYLNTEFYEKAFNAEEKAIILDSNVVNHDNPVYGTPGGNDTVDKVYIPSLEEAMEYYGVEAPEEGFYDQIGVSATQFAIEKGVWLEIPDSNRCWIWLRSPGSSLQKAAEIGSAGYLSFNGGDLNAPMAGERGLRPMIQINAK